MPMVRYQVRNEYGLSDPQLFDNRLRDDPEALLEGVAMAGLVGLLRQLGDLAEFAADIFHDLHEQVMATASRGHGLTLRLHQLEADFPSLELALISQISLPNAMQNEGIQCHTNVHIDQNLITRGDMPRFVMDSYEECRAPPRLFTLDKFDVAGAGACLKRYSDPSFFKTELASSYSIETEDAPRERKPRKIKKKATRWKKGETLESLLISTSDSPPSLEDQSSGKAPISRGVKLKFRRLRNSDNNARKIYHSNLHELIESQQKIILDDSGRQSNIKPESNGISKQVSVPVSSETENELQNMHKVYPIQEQNEVSSGSEKIEIAFETASSRQTKEKTMTDSDDIASEHDNFVDALNTIEIDTETDSENISKSDPVKSSQKETMHENLGPDSVGELVGTDKGLELNREIEFGEATEEFFDNDDLMDVSSTSSLHSDGVHQTDQVSISHGCNLAAELNIPADDTENKLGAAKKTSTVNETQSGFEVLVGLPTQLHGHQEQTNFHQNINMPVADASPETPEIPIDEDYLGSHEEHEYLINNRSSADLEEIEEPCVNPIEVSQVELRNISEEILNLEEYLISTSKDGSISQDTFSHGGKEASSHAITAEPLDVHTEEATQNFEEDKLEDPNERLEHEHIDKLEDVSNDHSDKFKDVLNGEVSLFSNKDGETVPGSTSSIPAEETTDLSANMTGSDLEGLHQIRIQHNNDPTTQASDDYMDEDRSTSNKEAESSSSAPHSPIDIPEETGIQGSYPKYHMDDFIKPDEGLLDLGNTQEETHRDESSHHCEAETQAKQFDESEDWPQYPDADKIRVLSINNKPPEPQAKQFNESEDWPQYPDEDESRVLLINNKPADEYFHDDCQNNSASKLHDFSADDNVSLEVCTQNPFSNNIYVRADGMHSNKSVTLPDKECEMWVGDLEVEENEEASHTADVLREPTGSPRERIFEPEFGTKTTSMSQKDAVLQTDVEFGSDTSLNFEVGEHLHPEKETIMEPCYAGNTDHVHDVYEEELLMQDGFAHTNAVATSAEVSKLLEEDLETKSLESFEGVKVNNELLVETSELNEEGNVKDIAPIPLLVKNEILVEECRNIGIASAESGVVTSPVVTTDAFVDFPKLSGDDNAQGGVLTHFLLKNEVLVEPLKNNEEDSAEGDVPQSPVLNNKSVNETMVLNEEYNSEECNAEGGVVLENEVLVEALNISETGDAEGGETANSAANNEVAVETSKEGNAEDGRPLPSVIRSEVPVEALKTDEKYSAEEEDNCEAGVPVPFVDHVHELLQNKEQKTEKHEVSVESINEKEEESADTVLPTFSADHVHETLQEPTNLGFHEPDTSPSSTFEECQQESVGYANLVFTTEGENITQSCTISLDNPLFDASPCQNLSEESSECHSNKPVPCINVHNNQEKLQEDIITEILHNDSTSGTVDPNKSMIAGSFHSSSFVKDQKLPQEDFDFKPSNVLSGNKSTDGVLANNTLVNVSVESKENELDMSSVDSLASEHKPPPLPPLGWRMGGKLSKGISLPSSEHSSKPADETNQKPSVQISSMEAPPSTNHEDSGRAEGEKLRVMSLSDLPPLSCQHEFVNPCSSSLTFPGANVPSMEYANGSNADVGLVVPEMRVSQYAWPDAQHPFLPVSTWSTGPSLVHVNQPGYLISLEDNLWAQYGIGTTVEDDRLVRKHHSIRNIPRNPLMDAVAAHDRSTMRKVSELVKPDDKSNTDKRNSLLEQIRNKSFSLRPVGAQKTTSVKVPQTNLKVAAIVEKANAIRQAFVGSDEEDGDSWSDA